MERHDTTHHIYSYKNNPNKPSLTEEQIREDVEVIQMINRRNKNIRLQCNGGANILCTNDLNIMHHVQNIPDYYIGGICNGIKCTKKGIFYLQCTNHDVKLVQIYYSKQAPKTVVSPTDTVTSHFDKSVSWIRSNNVKKGEVKL